MRSPARRAVSWVVGGAMVVAGAVVGWQVLKPDFPEAPASPTTTTTAAVAIRGRPTTTSVESTTTEPAPVTTTGRRSPVPEVDVGAVGELTTLNSASIAGRTSVGVLAAAAVLPSAFVTDPKGEPHRNEALLDDVQ